MSRTISVGVSGPSHWSYMATVLADCLEQTLASSQVQPIPKGVYRDALGFLKLALEGSGDSLPRNPPASINAYAIAAEAAPAPTSEPESRADLHQRLLSFEGLLKSFGEPRALDQEESKIVNDFRAFLQNLRAEGKSQTYEHAVRWEPTPPTP